ncbi:transcriptional regulator NrdR [Candidatus Paracaedibacter symbiosus]|uniref:transcriptional regulator NrdR n=1 Tax=Candidatus Paracaedibacter symbiosus TaxID=244582 RepID=UPI000509BFFF|nr:transcriptional regulator NrdR [Candidatus Paracaedibacter symbiosus]
MRCPFCSHFDTTVKDSRTTDDLSAVRRRRQCPECGSRFTTFERIQLRDLMVIKKNKLRVPFHRDKLASSIETALHKRPIPPDQIDRVISGIIRRLETSGEIEIPTHVIGEMAIEALFNLDTVAYIRFASVYHEFQNVEDFVTFISNMSKSDTQNTLEL